MQNSYPAEEKKDPIFLKHKKLEESKSLEIRYQSQNEAVDVIMINTSHVSEKQVKFTIYAPKPRSEIDANMKHNFSWNLQNIFEVLPEDITLKL